MSLRSQLETDEKELGVGSDGGFFRFEKGSNKFRVLSNWKAIAQHSISLNERPVICFGKDKGCPYHGEGAIKDKEGRERKPSMKGICYILDRKDEKIKIAFLPYTVIKAIVNLSEDPDWTFTSEDFKPFMPYDLTIVYNKDEAPADMYKTIPSPIRIELTKEQLVEFSEKKPIEEFVETLKEKEMIRIGQSNSEGIQDFPPEDGEDESEVDVKNIPF